jgi:hypothetical protein
MTSWFKSQAQMDALLDAAGQPLGHIPPVEFEQLHYQHQESQAMVA